MTVIGKAVAHGAVTVINAISCGFGAALGVELMTEASVKLTNEPGRIEGRILSDPEENTILIEKTVHHVLKHFRLEGEHGAYVETQSNIPIARGLKSSSVAANAVSLAVFAALQEEVDDLTVVNLGIDAAMDAGVTITGAFDDACASYFGNIVITDNYTRKILKQYHLDERWLVLIYAPPEKAYTATSNIEKMKLIADEVKALHKLALLGDYWPAMTLNGLVYSAALGYDPTVAIDALEAGASAAGLSGTGPAVAAVVPQKKVEGVKNAWKKYGGEIIETRINPEKAHVVP
ncbi:MAG: shikimate kinase [Candidatus Bathyarchaeota archaeon]|nr:shikimate kinase [Candidatus Bathyarchaeota archaeon]